ncbi:MAG: tetratricopeptide repeat protein, partial [Bacteroidota bacterium]
QRAMTELLPKFDALGEEGAELKGKVEKNIPSMQYKAAVKAYKAKDLKGAIKGFENALALSTTYNNEDIPKQVNPQLPSVYYSYGRSLIKAKDKKGAMAAFDQSIAMNPEFAKAYYGKSMLFRNEKFRDSMFVYVDKAITLAGDDAKSVAVFKKGTLKHLYSKASSYNKSKQYKKAVTVLEKAMTTYVDDNTKNIGKYHYQMGKAFAGLNKTTDACAAYKKVKAGKYLEAAKYEVQHTLKCK